MSRRAMAFVALCVVACGGQELEPWTTDSGFRWRDVRVGRGDDVGFTLLSPQRTGMTSSNDITDAELIENQHLLNGSGVALGDVDGDGWVDVFFTRLSGPNVLYRNNGGWRFEDVTTRAGVAAADRYSTGAVLADVDGDGDLDLLVTALGGPNALFVNDGTGVFTEAPDAGLESDRGSHTMALADVDGDADLDLYVTNYKVKSVKDLFPPEVRAFDNVVRQDGDAYVLAAEFREHYRLEMQGNRLARLEIAEADVLYLNDGTGRFEAVPFTTGRFLDPDGRPLTEPPADWGLTARFHDADDDGDPDLYVTNDFESADRFWLNDGHGVFRLAPRLALRTISQSSMAVDFSDIDRDGDMDFFAADMLSRDLRRRRTQMALTPADVPAIGVFDDRPQIQRNTLFENRGDGTYAEVAALAGVAASGWSWGSMFLDVDLDGFEDLLVANGYGHDALDGETQRMITQRRAGGANWREDILQFPPLSLPNAAFRNQGDFTFEDVSTAWGFGVEDDVSHGIGSADLDGDGDLDIVVNRQGAAPAVYRNDATERRLAVRLRGRPPNTQGVGSRIRVSGGPGGVQLKEVTSGGMYLSGSDPLYGFAAGNGGNLAIEVHWRSGRRSLIQDVQPNRVYEVTEPDAPVPDGVDRGAPTHETSAPLFRDVSALLDHRHVERDYADFARQPMLPHRMSQLGPGVTWYDADRDGDDDLVVTSGAGGSLAFRRNDGDRFVAVPITTSVAEFDLTTALPLRTRETVSLLVGQMNYEAASPRAAVAAPGVLRVELPGGRSRPAVAPTRVTEAVAGARSGVGPLALADYDGDGDLDLFVGGRVMPAAYPLAASSRLFENDGAGFVRDADADGPFQELGLVSAALFTDIDADGDPDLVLALEWGRIRLFENSAGQFRDITAARGLAGHVGRWNGVASGDLDGDGSMDLVATNWGSNSLLEISPHRPLQVFFGDLDNNGSLEVIEAQLDERLGGPAPLAPLSNLMTAMPFVQRRIASFAEFADATVQDIVGPALRNASSLEVTTLEHTVFFNRGDRFEARPLPREAQLAPSFSVGIADFDGDGHEDVFLTHNFFPTRPEAERHDAGRGLWLRGDGSGGLTPVSASATGVAVYGDQRGAALADYDGDGRLDLAVSQNGAATVLYHNEGATPGVRVRLEGSDANPDAIGATIRLVYGERRGPARELQAGSGYWSHNSPVHVLGVQGQATAVWVRWPGGRETVTALPPTTQEVVVPRPRELDDSDAR